MPRPMRRARRAMHDPENLRELIESCDTVRIASVDADGPFITPMSFGFDWEAGDGGAPVWTIWLHSASEGRKADAWNANPQVAIELDRTDGIVTGARAADYSIAYRSIMGTGRIALARDASEKRHGLARIMEHMAPGAPTEVSDADIEHVAVWRIDVETFTGKRGTR